MRSQPAKVRSLLDRGIGKYKDLEAGAVGFPEQRPVWLEHGEPGREWWEVGGEGKSQIW